MPHRRPRFPYEIPEWAELRGVESHLHDPVSSLEPFVKGSAHVAHRLLQAPPTVTVGMVVVDMREGIVHLRKSERGVLLRAAVAYLEDVARKEGGISVRASPPPEPELRELWDRLRKVYECTERERAGSGPRLDRVGSRIDLDEMVLEDLFDEVERWGWSEEIRVRIRLERPTDGSPVWSCDCASGARVGPCRHVRASLAAFLRHLKAGPEAARSHLAEALRSPPWLRRLLHAQRAVASARESASEVPNERFAWSLDLDPGGWPEVELYVQKRRKNGTWTAGRKASRTERLDLGTVATARDRDVLFRVLQAEYFTPGLSGALDVVEALIGHPHIFSARDKSKSVAVSRAKAGLGLVAAEGGLAFGLRLDGSSREISHWIFEPEGERALAVDADCSAWFLARVPSSLGVAASIVFRSGRLAIPDAGLEEALPILADLSRHVDLSVDGGLDLPSEPVPPLPAVRLRPDGEGIELEVVQPSPGGVGADLTPGTGPRELLRVREGRPLRLVRDLESERREAHRVRTALLEAGAEERSDGAFDASEPTTALDVLLALRGLPAVEVLWPAGEAPWRVESLSRGNLRVDVARSGAFFEVGGDVEVDEASLPLATILATVRAGRSFVRLSEGRFARLEDDLRQRVGTLDRLASGEKGARLTLGAAGATRLAEALGDDVAIEGDTSYVELLSRVEAARELVPTVPAGLVAELRPYQREGHAWLARLAHWQAGAVLADDMGLGKTIQVLALLLQRTHGPALVVAPTSVCAEWKAQAERFAPSLRARLYRGPDRGVLLEDLGPGDVLVASYTILHRDIDALEPIDFATFVLDEAQAIKNAATRRFRAARSIRADHVVALTGTPLENHLGELWAIFRVANPGLLGSWDRFRSRYAIPIERDGDPRALADLTHLIRPFLLRRTKAEVAPELPPRTEIVRSVTLGRAERSLYEANRRQILAALEADVAGQDRRFAVLAALTRLRQLACHPRLVDPASALRSAKLEAALELIEELIEGRQRALVFSQFTSHLALLRAELDRREIGYLYLDGSTPAEMRDRLVESWRAEEASLFLVSLKAGGTGLNLVGADCVLHLDPWWNPAVEDQATDRTHRIGQTKPVTVVRLISADTIEQSVVEIHDRKRALARGVLEGAAAAGVLDAEELVDLIRGGGRAVAEDDEDDEEDVVTGSPDAGSDTETRESTPGSSSPIRNSRAELVPSRPSSTSGERGDEPASPETPRPAARDDAPVGSGVFEVPVGVEGLVRANEVLEARLTAEVAAGRMARGSVTNYVRAATLVVEHARIEMAGGAEEMTAIEWFQCFCDAVASGTSDFPKSYRLFASACAGRMRRWRD